MANSAPPLKHPRLWWRAMLDRAEETMVPLPDVIHEFRSMMNSPPPPLSMEEAKQLSKEYPHTQEYIYRAFREEP